jgi:serine/threonine-protein kinase
MGAMMASTDARAPIPPGTKIGTDLTLHGVLGEGGTSIVYSAYHSVLKRNVAVKMSRPGERLGSNARLHREAQMCASVQDARIPRIFAFEQLDGGGSYLVMELVPGQPLSQLLLHRGVSAREACAIARELLGALRAVHAKGIVHRDIKPSNVMVELSAQGEARVRLLDFGVGKVVRAQTPPLSALTCNGELLGTPLYMAPEQICGQPVDERADLYSIGVVLYEMLAGCTPFRGASVAEVFATVLRDTVLPLSTLRPDLPLALYSVSERALMRKPEERFQTAAAMESALVLGMCELGTRDELPRRAKAALEAKVAENAPTMASVKTNKHLSGVRRRGFEAQDMEEMAGHIAAGLEKKSSR